MWLIEWHHCQCPWMTLKVTFAVWNFLTPIPRETQREFYHIARRAVPLQHQSFLLSILLDPSGHVAAGPARPFRRHYSALQSTERPDVGGVRTTQESGPLVPSATVATGIRIVDGAISGCDRSSILLTRARLDAWLWGQHCAKYPYPAYVRFKNNVRVL